MSDSQIEEIKAKLNVVDVISGYMKLEKAGVNFKGLCPFHGEKTPSFMVSPSRQSWHCFGCGEGGDIFTFIQKIEGVEFFESLKTLANRAGVVLEQENAQDRQDRSEKTRLYDLCEKAAQHFEKNLESQNQVLNYLRKRGVKPETQEEWRVGYALDLWRSLLDFLRALGFRDSEIEKSGLAIRQADARLHDRFRNRLMFPISDTSGRIVGFSGRTMSDLIPSNTEKPDSGKYINSPETILFNKSRVLYGFDKAKTEIRKENSALLVEGQFDLILSWQDGIKNIVASSGTALTQGHLEILKRLTDNLLLSFDQDEAGFRATKRGIDLALDLGFNIKIVALDSEDADTKDPADFVKIFPGKLKENLKEAKPVMEYYLNRILKQFDSTSLDGKKMIVQILLPEIKRHPNALERSFWIQELAQKINVKESDLEQELSRIIINREMPYQVFQVNPAFAKKTKKEILSEQILALSLKNPALILEISHILSLLSPKYSEIALSLVLNQKNFNFSKVKLGLPSELQSRFDYLSLVADIWQEHLEPNFDFEKEANFLLNELEKEHTKEVLVNLEINIKKAEKENPSLVENLINEFQTAYKRLINKQ